jgi:hypothetical protein
MSDSNVRDTKVRRRGVFVLWCVINIFMAFGLRSTTADEASMRADKNSGPETPKVTGSRIGAVVPGPSQPQRVRTAPDVLPDSSLHSSAARGWCVLPGDVRGGVWLAVYRHCSNVDAALVNDPVPQGSDRPVK